MHQRSRLASGKIDHQTVERFQVTLDQLEADELSDSDSLDMPENELSSNISARQYILIVDDERNVLFLLREALKKLINCTVLIAESAEQALVLYEQYKIDLLITDHHLPGIDGLTLATRIRQLSPQMPIMMLTAHANEMLHSQAASISIRQILNKPVKVEILRNLVAQALSESKNNFTGPPASL